MTKLYHILSMSCLLLLSQPSYSMEEGFSPPPVPGNIPPPPNNNQQGGIKEGLLKANLRFLIEQGMLVSTNENCTADDLFNALIKQGRLNIQNLPNCTGMEGGRVEQIEGAHDREPQRPIMERMQRHGQRMMPSDNPELQEKLQRRREMMK